MVTTRLYLDLTNGTEISQTTDDLTHILMTQLLLSFPIKIFNEYTMGSWFTDCLLRLVTVYSQGEVSRLRVKERTCYMDKKIKCPHTEALC